MGEARTGDANADARHDNRTQGVHVPLAQVLSSVAYAGGRLIDWLDGGGDPRRLEQQISRADGSLIGKQPGCPSTGALE